VLEDEVPDDLDQLLETITAETGAASEIEARLAGWPCDLRGVTAVKGNLVA
jgi:hypothetical protein